MKITKPDDALLLQGYHARGGNPALMVTVAYVTDADGACMSEQDVWPWLLTHFADEPFDAGFKKERGVFGVAGAAHAPGGQAVKAMSVRVRVGSLEKSLHVHGDRFWDRGPGSWQISPAAMFATMPVTLNRAFGGAACPENPYGRGYFQESEPAQGLALPNIELPGDPIVSPADRPPVATFSVLPSGARSRMQWVGKVDSAWERERFPWLPDDTDARWFDGVPGDQAQNAYWQGDEAWSVQGMHPVQEVVSGSLPGLRPRLLVRRHGDTSPESATEAVMDLDTVWLFPNEQRVMVMYRAAVAVAREDAADIAALGVFTERLADAPRTAADWDQHWREQDGASAQDRALERPQPSRDPQALADHEAAVQRWADELKDDIQRSLDEGADHANRAIAGLQKNGPVAAGLDLPRAQAPRIMPVPVKHAGAMPPAMSADQFEASLKADIQASLDEGQAVMQATVRDIAAQNGMDPEDLLEHIEAVRHNALSASDKTLAEHLAQADIPEDMRDELLGRARIFQDEMDAMQAQFDTMAVAPAAASRGSGDAGNAGDAGIPRGPTPTVLTAADVQARAKAGQSLTGMSLTGLDLRCMDLSDADFTDSVITDCEFNEARLCRAVFDRTVIKGCGFDQANLTSSSWHMADVEKAGFSGARLEQARLTDATFLGCHFTQADLSGAILDASSMGESIFDGACFIQASLAVTSIWACRGASADFSHGRLAGVRIDSECDFAQSRFVQTDLRGASLQKSGFRQASFNEADLSDAFVCDCDLGDTTGWRIRAQRTDFKNSRFTNARWTAANLFEASFDHAVLENVDLSGSNLYAIETRTAFVRGVQVQGALLSRTRLLQDHAAGGGS